MTGTCFADRIGRHMELTVAERSALAQLEERRRSVRRGAALLRANDRSTELFLLRRGTAMSYVLLDDGSRQIVRFYFPGDILGWSALAFDHSPETLVASTDAEVSPFDRSAVAGLARDHPRLVMAITALCQLERQVLSDRLTAVGRVSALGRVAALLIEIRDRLQGGGAQENGFLLGLTQEEVGDATGLTAVHVNRMLRQLEIDRLIVRENGRVIVLDEDRLTRLANHVDRDERLDLSWLSPTR